MKTINRQPMGVKELSYDAMDYKFFNHNNWKGVCDDKNYLGVDQETFSDSKNVYIDGEEILRSRPSIKPSVIKYVNGDTEETIENILDIKVFGSTTVYKCSELSSSSYYLYFVNKDVPDINVKVPLKYIVNNEDTYYSDVKLFYTHNKIFVFSEHDLCYYDTKENVYYSCEISGDTIGDAKDILYIPTTKFIKSGEETENESLNELIGKYIIRYSYDDFTGTDWEQLIGKTIYVSIDGEEKSLVFQRSSQYTIVNKLSVLSPTNIADDKILGNSVLEGRPLVHFASTGASVMSSYTYTINGSTKVPTINWIYNYAIDGKNYIVLPPIENAITECKISEDGNYAFTFKDDGMYVYHLNVDDASWQNITVVLNKSYPSDITPLQLNTVNSSGETFNKTCIVNGYMKDINLWSFTYGKNLYGSAGDPLYKDFIIVYYCGNTIKYKELFKAGTSSQIEYTKPDDQFYNMGVKNITESGTFSNKTIIANYGIPSALQPDTWIDEVIRKYNNANYGDITCKFTNINIKLSRNFAGLTLLSETALLTFDYVRYDRYNTPMINQIHGYYNIGNITVDTSITTFHQISTVDDIGILYNYTQDEGFKIKFISNSNKTDTINNDDGILLTTGVARTLNITPDIYCEKDTTNDKFCYLLNFSVQTFETQESPWEKYKYLYKLEVEDGTYDESSGFYRVSSEHDLQHSLNESIVCHNGIYKNAYVLVTENYKFIYVSVGQGTGSTTSDKLISRETVGFEPNPENFYKQKLVLSKPYGILLTNKNLMASTDLSMSNYDLLPMLVQGNPIDYYDHYGANTKVSVYIQANNYVYNNELSASIEVNETIDGDIKYMLPDVVSVTDKIYLSKDNILYISGQGSNVEVDEFKLYFPVKDIEKFDNNITNLHPISQNELAIFSKNSVSYISEQDEKLFKYNSKIPLGIELGSDIITTYDNKYTIFATKRGVVAMSYQDFINSTEQALTYLSDSIFSMFDIWNKGPIKILQYKFWLLFYKEAPNENGDDSYKTQFLFDMRNNSWWPLQTDKFASHFVEIDYNPYFVINGNRFTIETSYDNYYDYELDNGKNIDWYIVSQILHFNAINYYKHIISITLNEVSDSENEIFIDLIVRNYRKKLAFGKNTPTSGSEIDTFSFNVDFIRNFVKRLNYYKVNEFQYTLQNNKNDNGNLEIKATPFSITNITIKYLLTGQVR